MSSKRFSERRGEIPNSKEAELLPLFHITLSHPRRLRPHGVYAEDFASSVILYVLSLPFPPRPAVLSPLPSLLLLGVWGYTPWKIMDWQVPY